METGIINKRNTRMAAEFLAGVIGAAILAVLAMPIADTALMQNVSRLLAPVARL